MRQSLCGAGRAVRTDGQTRRANTHWFVEPLPSRGHTSTWSDGQRWATADGGAEPPSGATVMISQIALRCSSDTCPHPGW